MISYPVDDGIVFQPDPDRPSRAQGDERVALECTTEIRGRTVRFSGLLAWFIWRGIYLGKLPGLERKVRVMIDWVIELFFPRDIVQTIEFN